MNPILLRRLARLFGVLPAFPLFLSTTALLSLSVSILLSTYYLMVFASAVVGAIIDKNPEKTRRSLALVGGLSLASAALASLLYLAVERFAIFWRVRLVKRIHAAYIVAPALLKLCSSSGGGGGGGGVGGGSGGGGSGGGVGPRADAVRRLDSFESSPAPEPLAAPLLNPHPSAPVTSPAISGNTYWHPAHPQVLDNPNDRVTSDVYEMSRCLITVLTGGTAGGAYGVLGAPFTIIWYVYRSYQEVGYLAPVSISGYFLAGVIVSRFLMAWVSRNVVREERCEANLRYAHQRVRGNAESIVFYAGMVREASFVDALLLSAAGAMRRLITSRFFLNFFTMSYAYGGSIIVYFLVSLTSTPTGGSKTAGEMAAHIGRTLSFCISLMGGYTSLINVATPFSEFAGFATRVAELWEAAETAAAEVEGEREEREEQSGAWDGALLAEEARTEDAHRKDGVIELKNVSWGVPRAPDSPPLGQGLSVVVERGCHLAIMGPSGCGKSSLLRVIAGVWPAKRGEVHRPSLTPQKLIFLPQRPYLIVGTLREQVLYPRSDDDPGIANAQIERALDLAGLPRFAQRAGGFSCVRNWDECLSPGEQQRLAISRLFFYLPKFAVLDEATGALDEDTEEFILRGLMAVGVTLIMVTQRSSVGKICDRVLRRVQADDILHRWVIEHNQKMFAAIRAFANKRALRSSQEAGDLFLAYLCLLHFSGDPSVADEAGRLSTHTRLSSLSLPKLRDLVSAHSSRAAISLCEPAAAAVENDPEAGFAAAWHAAIKPPVQRAVSTVSGAGDGLLATRPVRIGEPLALFPGTVYMLRDHAHVPRGDRDLLVMRYDEAIIDASQVVQAQSSPARGIISSRVVDGTSEAEDQLTSRPYLAEVPHGLGHLINHPPPGTPPNCIGVSVDFPASTPISVQSVIPNGYFRIPSLLDSPKWPRPVMRGYLFLATQEIEEGEEVFIDYRFNPNGAFLPNWYHPVDSDAAKRRWGVEKGA